MDVSVALPQKKLVWQDRWNQFRHNSRLHAQFYARAAKSLLGLQRPSNADLHAIASGITFVLPGVEGESPYCHNMRNGLLDAGIPGAVVIFDWCIPFPRGYFPNLMHLRRNHAKAAELAARIQQYQQDFPGRPVRVVANSGGAFVAIAAVEKLPPDYPVDAVALLGGAISCDYDLSRALARTRNGILNSYSQRDWLVLGWGTRIFGTSDRKPSDACGFKGFRRPATANPALYARLHQLPWTPGMGGECQHWGSHVTTTSRNFVRRYVAPWLMQNSM